MMILRWPLTFLLQGQICKCGNSGRKLYGICRYAMAVLLRWANHGPKASCFKTFHVYTAQKTTTTTTKNTPHRGCGVGCRQRGAGHDIFETEINVSSYLAQQQTLKLSCDLFYFWNVIPVIISSPELCSGWAIVITFRPSSVRPCVRPCVRPLTFSNDFSSEAPEPILLKFHMEPP